MIRVIYLIVISVIIVETEACVYLIIKSSLPDRNLLNTSECETRTVYHNFKEGETLLLICSKDSANASTYLDLDGNLEWKENSITKNMTFTQQQNNTMIECSLKYLHNDSWSTTARDLGQIQVIFHMKDANITIVSTLIEELTTSITNTSVIPPMNKLLHNANNLTLTRSTTTDQFLNSKAPPSLSSIHNLPLQDVETTSHKMITNSKDISNSSASPTILNDYKIKSVTISALISGGKKQSISTSTLSFPKMIKLTTISPSLNSTTSTFQLASTRMSGPEATLLTSTPILTTFLSTNSSLNSRRSSDWTLPLTTASTLPTTLEKHTSSTFSTLSEALITTPSIISLSTPSLNKYMNNVTNLLHSIEPTITTTTKSTDDTNKKSITSRNLTTFLSTVEISDSRPNAFRNFNKTSALTTYSTLPTKIEELITTPLISLLKLPVSKYLKNTTNLPHSAKPTTTTITPSTSDSVITVDEMHAKVISTRTPTLLSTKSSLNPHRSSNWTLSLTKSSTFSTSSETLITTPSSISIMPVNTINNVTNLLHSVESAITTSNNEVKITTNETSIKSKILTIPPINFNETSTPTTSSNLPTMVEELITKPSTTFSPLPPVNKYLNNITTSSTFSTSSDTSITTPSTISISTSPVNKYLNNVKNLPHSVDPIMTRSTNEVKITTNETSIKSKILTTPPSIIQNTNPNFNPLWNFNKTSTLTTSSILPTMVEELITKPSTTFSPLPPVNKYLNNITTSSTFSTSSDTSITTPSTISISTSPVNKYLNNVKNLPHSVDPIMTRSTNEVKITTNETSIKSKILTTPPSIIQNINPNFNPLWNFNKTSTLTTSSILPTMVEELITKPSTTFSPLPPVNKYLNNITTSSTFSTSSDTSITTPSTISISTSPVNKYLNNVKNLPHSVDPIMTRSTNEVKITTNETSIKSKILTTPPSIIQNTNPNFNPLWNFNKTSTLTTSSILPTMVEELLTKPSTTFSPLPPVNKYLNNITTSSTFSTSSDTSITTPSTISISTSPVNKYLNNVKNLPHSVDPIMTRSTNEVKITTNETSIKSKILTTPPSIIQNTNPNFNPLWNFNKTSTLTTSSILPTMVEELITKPSTTFSPLPPVNKYLNNITTSSTFSTSSDTPITTPSTISISTSPVNKYLNNVKNLPHSVDPIMTRSTNEVKITTNETSIKSKILTTPPSIIQNTNPNFNPLWNFNKTSTLTTSSILPTMVEELITKPSTTFSPLPPVNKYLNNITNLFRSAKPIMTTMMSSTNESIVTADEIYTKVLTSTAVPTTILSTNSTLNPHSSSNWTLPLTTSATFSTLAEAPITTPSTISLSILPVKKYLNNVTNLLHSEEPAIVTVTTSTNESFSTLAEAPITTSSTISISTLPVNKYSDNVTNLLHSVEPIVTTVTTSINRSKITTNETSTKSEILTTPPSKIKITDSNFNPFWNINKTSAPTTTSFLPTMVKELLTKPSTTSVSIPPVNKYLYTTTNLFHSAKATMTTMTPSTSNSVNTIDEIHTKNIISILTPTFLSTNSSLHPYRSPNRTLPPTTFSTFSTSSETPITTSSTISISTSPVNKYLNNVTNSFHSVEPKMTTVTTSTNKTNETSTKSEILTTPSKTIQITDSNFNPLWNFDKTSALTTPSILPTMVEELITKPSTTSLSIPPLNKYLNNITTVSSSILPTSKAITPPSTQLSTATVTKQKPAAITTDRAIIRSTLTSRLFSSTKSDEIDISIITTTEMDTTPVILLNHPSTILITNSIITTSNVTSAVTTPTTPNSTLEELFTVPSTITVSESVTSISKMLSTPKTVSPSIQTSDPKISVLFNTTPEPSQGFSSTVHSNINSIITSSNTKPETLSTKSTIWNTTISSISSSPFSTISATTTNIPVTTKSSVISSTPSTLSSLVSPTTSFASATKIIASQIEKKDLPDMMAFMVVGVILIFVLIGSFIGVYTFVKRDTQKKNKKRLSRKRTNFIDPEIPAYPPQWNSNIYKNLENESNSSSIDALQQDLYTIPVPKSARHKIKDEVMYANEALSKKAQETNRVEIQMDAIYNNTLPRDQKEYKPEWIYANQETSSNEPNKIVYAQIKPKRKMNLATYVNVPKNLELVNPDNTQPTYSDPDNIYDKLL